MTAELIKAAAFMLIAAGVSILIKSYRPEYSFILTVAAGCTVLAAALLRISPYFSSLSDIFARAGTGNEYFTVVLKALGVSYITSFAADSCRDFGQSSLAAKTELCGKCAILVLCIPLITKLLDTAIGFI